MIIENFDIVQSTRDMERKSSRVQLESYVRSVGLTCEWKLVSVHSPKANPGEFQIHAIVIINVVIHREQLWFESPHHSEHD